MLIREFALKLFYQEKYQYLIKSHKGEKYVVIIIMKNKQSTQPTQLEPSPSVSSTCEMRNSFFGESPNK